MPKSEWNRCSPSESAPVTMTRAAAASALRLRAPAAGAKSCRRSHSDNAASRAQPAALGAIGVHNPQVSRTGMRSVHPASTESPINPETRAEAEAKILSLLTKTGSRVGVMR